MVSVLGFDLGGRITGVAIGQTVTDSATPLPPLRHAQDAVDWQRIGILLKEWHPDVLVVGLPLELDGTEQHMSHQARRFATELEQRTGLPVHLVDERLTTREAKRRFADQRAAGALRRKHVELLDSLAAQIIVENWLAAS